MYAHSSDTNPRTNSLSHTLQTFHLTDADTHRDTDTDTDKNTDTHRARIFRGCGCIRMGRLGWQRKEKEKKKKLLSCSCVSLSQ
jgi:hypothetical protein